VSKRWVLVVVVAAAPLNLYSQFEVQGRKVDVHGFVSQGFAVSNGNNYLTMKTTAAFTDGAINGAWRPQLDWAFGDYKFKDWFGIRVGKVKTTLGLYADIQDEAFLTPWAILRRSELRGIRREKAE